ncbi:hypothetical protein D3C77_561640 [compost metagenome]
MAQKLGIRPPSLYNHIEGLNGLRKVMALDSLEQLENAMIAAITGNNGDVALTMMAKAYVEFARERPGLYEAMLYAPGAEDEELRHAGDGVNRLVTSVIQEAYDLDDEQAMHASRGFRSLLHGFASLEQQGSFGIPFEVNDSIQYNIKAFMAGLNAMYAANQTQADTHS